MPEKNTYPTVFKTLECYFFQDFVNLNLAIFIAYPARHYREFRLYVGEVRPK